MLFLLCSEPCSAFLFPCAMFRQLCRTHLLPLQKHLFSARFCSLTREGQAKAKARSQSLCAWARRTARAMLALSFPGLSRVGLILSRWIWVDNLCLGHGTTRAWGPASAGWRTGRPWPPHVRLLLMHPWKSNVESSEAHLSQAIAQGALPSSCLPLEHHYSFTARCPALLAY